MPTRTSSNAHSASQMIHCLTHLSSVLLKCCRMKTSTCVEAGSARWSTLRSTSPTSGEAAVAVVDGAWAEEAPAEATLAGPVDLLVKVASGRHEAGTVAAVPGPGPSHPSSPHLRWTTGTTSLHSWPPEVLLVCHSLLPAGSKCRTTMECKAAAAGRSHCFFVWLYYDGLPLLCSPFFECVL